MFSLFASCNLLFKFELCLLFARPAPRPSGDVGSLGSWGCVIHHISTTTTVSSIRWTVGSTLPWAVVVVVVVAPRLVLWYVNAPGPPDPARLGGIPTYVLRTFAIIILDFIKLKFRNRGPTLRWLPFQALHHMKPLRERSGAVGCGRLVGISSFHAHGKNDCFWFPMNVV